MKNIFKKLFCRKKNAKQTFELNATFPLYEYATNHRFLVKFPQVFGIPEWIVKSAEIPILTDNSTDTSLFTIVIREIKTSNNDGTLIEYDIRKKLHEIIKSQKYFDLTYEFCNSCGKTFDSFNIKDCKIVELGETTIDYSDDSIHEFKIKLAHNGIELK